MDITFRDKKLKKYANDDRLALQKLGRKRSQVLKQRLDDLRAAESLEDVRYLPGRFHELTANRKGQWSCDLDHPFRLIFEPHEDPVPENEHGQYIWIEIRGVEVLEITDYHKER